MTRFPSGTAFELYDSLDSTSLEAKRRAEKSMAEPRWFVALKQTAGYGRRGRDWKQRTGDFAGTLLFRPDGPVEHRGQLSFIVALTLAFTLDEFIDAERIQLKWPNDVLLGGAKCAGILLENLDDYLAIGIGVNIVNAPGGLEYKTARMMDFTDAPPEPAQLCARLDHHFWTLYREWRATGFPSIKNRWTDRAVGIGTEITVRLPNETLSGTFNGIDDNGALILRSGAGKRIITAGEVFFGPRR
ncbi:biotin--[acetyl-CoA-carboxylase] ligase [Hyphococcus lacteus]|uniref:biotin--[biotin carboxyl-carrier protein] ligase n=1 Tax=Hyphococcus lacteus TaxID=3143536 RepID=A0ABV3YZQ1_9PROT